MDKICKNCIHYLEDKGECEVKLKNYHTSAYHECDEVMVLFDFTFGEGPTLFFEPKKRTKNGRH